MNYRIAIVEDEKHQQERLVSLLKPFTEFKIIGIASNLSEASRLLTEESPDLAFMDVMLPPHTSFDLLKIFSHIPFEIIFTTSYQEFAIKAFRLSAVDYLLKPVVPEELAQALEKFKWRKSATSSARHIETLLGNLHRNKHEARIALPTNNGFTFISVQDIIRVESDTNYSTFHITDKRKIIVSKNLKECEQMLTDYQFFRIHHSHLINLNYVNEYMKGEGGYVKMTDGKEIEVSRRRKDEFLMQLRHI